jgi:hypothetical protein
VDSSIAPSDKQVELLVFLWGKVRGWGEITPKELAAQARALDRSVTSANIKKLNKERGWDRKTSPATPAQINFVIDLELKVNGKVTKNPRMTYQEAHDEIKMLKRLAEEQGLIKVKAVIDFTEYKTGTGR